MNRRLSNLRRASYSTLAIWPCAWNPPNGSWGIIKFQPTGAAPTSRIPPTAVGGWLKHSLPGCRRGLLTGFERPDLNHPPTAVGGIRREKGFYVGRTLTIPQLPLGGLKNGSQICEGSLKSRLHIIPKL